MKKNTELKFVVCGLGSIGKRCLENLEALGVPCENIFVVRTRKGAANFGDTVLLEHGNSHAVFTSIEEALKEKPDVVLITNPTSLHIRPALEAAKNNCHVFVTKPLSDTLEGIDELIAITKKNKLTAFVSYQLRFHPLLIQIKEWLKEKKIGNIVSVHAELSERVTDFHPWEDYRISYTSRKDLGGGVILSFSHEIDYLYSLFGKPEWLFSAGGVLGGLDLDVEDIVKSIIQFPNNVIASLHLDFLKRPPRRFLEIMGENGRIYWDYFEKTLTHIPLDGEETVIKEPTDFERNAMHIDELEHFLDCIANNKKPLISLGQGKNVLEIALAMKKSMQDQKVIYLNNS